MLGQQSSVIFGIVGIVMFYNSTLQFTIANTAALVLTKGQF